MTGLLSRRFLAGFSFLAVAMLALAPPLARADEASDAQATVDEAAKVLDRFVADPNLSWFHSNVHRAKGLLIVPTYGKAGFIIGGAGGSGVLIGRDGGAGTWSNPAFFTLGEASIGLQIGAQSSELIFLIMSDAGMRKMVDGKVQLGADMSVAAGPVGAGATAATADVLVFARSKGAYAGVSVEGAVLHPWAERNAAYYGKSVTPAEIVMKRSVSNPGAKPLIDSATRHLGR